MEKVLGGLELGGTKVLVAAGVGPDDLETVRYRTSDPASTLAAALDFLRPRGIAALGIGSFGPLRHGGIGTTPKRGWSDVDLVGPFEEALGVPVVLTTDVSAAALGEARWGAERGRDPFLYLTVGTGVGGGLLRSGEPVPGLEMGHVRVPHDGAFAGVCPFHGDCLEGLASGPALAARWGRAELPVGHPAWAEEARLLGRAIAGFVLTLAPARVCLGGGVGSRPDLLALVRREVAGCLADYPRPVDVDDLLVAPALGTSSGVVGALELARRAVPGDARAPRPS